MNRNYRIAVVVFVLFQLVVVGNIVWENTVTWKNGKEFKFRCAMYDPIQPFAGHYMQLRFDNPCVEEKPSNAYNNGEYFAVLKEAADGFCEVSYVSKAKPKNTDAFIKVTDLDAYSVVRAQSGKCRTVVLPFDKFYINEQDAPKAESMVNEALRDTSSRVWVTVNVYKGKFALKEIIINKKSLKARLDE